MKCLTVKAPWAQMIVRGTGICGRCLPPDRPLRKDVENRSWDPGKALRRGDSLAIHCGRSVDREAMVLFGVDPEAVRADLGCVLGSVIFCGAHPWPAGWWRSPWHEVDLVGWYVEAPLVLDAPAPAKGRLGLWDWDNERGE